MASKCKKCDLIPGFKKASLVFNQRKMALLLFRQPGLGN